MKYSAQSEDAAATSAGQAQMSNLKSNGEIDQLAVNTIRFLSVDAVQKANSGHPGAPMGAAPVVYTLWDKFLKHNPRNPLWFNRDRFILSAGHASMLLYSLLHLTGYDISLEDIKNFRQWDSKTPGHPEYSPSHGIEVTTGPLGQGFAIGVGMAFAEKHLAAQFNRSGFNIIDHKIYALVSDGDLQEGISYEAASLAGHLGLGNLIYLYDDNGIQIEGKTSLTFSDDIRKRFEAVNWNVIGPIDGINLEQVSRSISEARGISDKPSLIICKTNIAYGSPGKQDSASSHGEPLGIDEVAATKKNLGWPYEPEFYVPDNVTEYMKKAIDRGNKSEHEWNDLFERYGKEFPEEYRSLQNQIKGMLPKNWDLELEHIFDSLDSPLPTRGASGKVLNVIAKNVENLMGGSADLGPSNKTTINGANDFGADCYSGQNIHFGVREHSMTAIADGIALHGGIIPYTGTFLVFSDYMRPSIRLAALMGLRVIFIFSHDSIGLGEDGPTHQPIEHISSLRAIPNLAVIRPADPHETVCAWKTALQRQNGPTVIITTRQKVPTLPKNPEAGRGGYILLDCQEQPRIILIASGSETQLVLEAAQKLQTENIMARAVSMPSMEIFEAQSDDYREKVLPSSVRKRIAVEAGATQSWYRYVGMDGIVIGIDHFGASAPAKILFEKFGFSAENILTHARKLLG